MKRFYNLTALQSAPNIRLVCHTKQKISQTFELPSDVFYRFNPEELGHIGRRKGVSLSNLCPINDTVPIQKHGPV
jgi:hypothetical protein